MLLVWRSQMSSQFKMFPCCSCEQNMTLCLPNGCICSKIAICLFCRLDQSARCFLSACSCCYASFCSDGSSRDVSYPSILDSCAVVCKETRRHTHLPLHQSKWQILHLRSAGLLCVRLHRAANHFTSIRNFEGVTRLISGELRMAQLLRLGNCMNKSFEVIRLDINLHAASALPGNFPTHPVSSLPRLLLRGHVHVPPQYSPEPLSLVVEGPWVSAIGGLVELWQKGLAGLLTGVVGELDCDGLGSTRWLLSIQALDGLLSFYPLIKADEAHTSGATCGASRSQTNRSPFYFTAFKWSMYSLYKTAWLIFLALSDAATFTHTVVFTLSHTTGGSETRRDCNCEGTVV